MSDEPKVGASAIPEIYYDLIARIVPGALILSAYGLGQIDKKFYAGEITFALILSYVIGLVLDILAGWFWWVTFFKRQKFWKKGWKNADRYKNDGELWLWIRSLRLVDRNLYTKMMAEKMLFASLSLASLFMFLIVLIRPPVCPLYCISRWYSIVVLILFAFFSWCMFRVNKSLSTACERGEMSTAA